MFVSAALAQTSAAPGSGFDITSIMPLVLIFIVFYFLLIRPQQKRAKEHKAMIEAVRRGDLIVTGGGILGKVAKVNEDGSVEVEVAENVRIKVLKGTISEVRSRTEPGPGEPKTPASPAAPKGFLDKLLGR